MTNLLVVGADLHGHSNVVDVRVRGGHIAEIGVALRPTTAERVLPAHGGALVPGLHDHHLHLLSLAAALESVPCGPPDTNTLAELAARLQQAAATAPTGGWLRGIGYHESVAGELDRWQLDRLCPDHPLRIQHRSGRLWLLNSRAVAATGLDRDRPAGAERDPLDRPTGRLYRNDPWIGTHVPEHSLDLVAVGQLLSASGITGVTDATPELSGHARRTLAEAVERGALPQHVLVLGAAVDSTRLPLGPLKLVVDDVAGIDPDALSRRIAATHADGRPVALHCVTRAEVVASIAAIETAGALAGDRLEHASELPFELIETVARLGLTIVSQPNFIAERGDAYLAELDPTTLETLYRGASVQCAGVALAAGSDAPFGSVDPWRAMRAAVDRQTRHGQIIGAHERLSPSAALQLFLGKPLQPGTARALKAGVPADLCLLDCPLRDALADLRREHVRATIIGGRMVYERGLQSPPPSP